MIRQVIDRINARMDYSFKDILVGVVHPHVNKKDIIPKASDGTTYADAIPDSTKTSIVYWEDYGGRTIDSCSRYRRINHTVRIVVWVNFNKITQSFDTCVREILRNIPSRVGSTTIEVMESMQKGEELFSRYNYPEAKQYITHPYDVFAFMVSVKYMDTFSCTV